MMDERFAFYLEKNNFLFNGDILVCSYKTTEAEMKKYGLTSNNVVLFIKHNKIKELEKNNDCDYFKEVKKIFGNSKIVLRLQSECFLGMYGDSHCDCEKQRMESIKIISKNNGIFIHLPQEAQGWGLHYKLQELELQVSGRLQNGEFIGQKDRDSAQKILLNLKAFHDNRSYEIIYDILKLLNLNSNEFLVITDSDKKIESLRKNGINSIKYSDCCNNDINLDNVSEYLIKICDETHNFDEEIVSKIITVIKNGNYNERTLEVLLSIVDKIKNNDKYLIKNNLRDKILNLYNEIICGEEKRYIIGNGKQVKIQNNFSCKVNSTIFKTLCNLYGKDIFDRICLEKIYYFKSKENDHEVRIRTSTILDCVEEMCTMFNGQMYAEQTAYDIEKKRVVQKECSVSGLRAFFENPLYHYVKRVEMVTIISENVLPDINIYIKKIPNTENRVMDIFGKKEKIQELINNILAINSKTLLNIVNDRELESQNFSNYNLRFADLNSIIEEEVSIYKLTKNKEEKENNGIRSKILLPCNRIKKYNS